MTENQTRDPGKPDTKKARQERLAAQLRDNLKKRKAQLRARKDVTSERDAQEH